MKYLSHASNHHSLILAPSLEDSLTEEDVAADYVACNWDSVGFLGEEAT